MALLTWDDTLKRADLIGGDIESQEDGIVFRGPLADIQEDGEVIRFLSPWCARLDPETGEWENWHITSSFVNKDVAEPQDIGGGRVFFATLFGRSCTIFPKSGSKLSSRKVKDLPKDSERLQALFPDLPFDRAVAERVCRDYTWPRVLENFSTLAADATVKDVLTLFRNDSSAEEFLWYYIEAVTDAKDVHQQVY
jgi:hypothetical protein